MKIIVEQVDNDETEVVLRCTDPNAPESRKIIAALEGITGQIPAQQNSGNVLLQPQSVLYCEYVNRCVFVYTAEEVLPCAMTLSQLEGRFPAFFRCSKNAVVNINHLTHLKSELHGRILAKLSNGEQILISRHYASALRTRLKER